MESKFKLLMGPIRKSRHEEGCRPTENYPQALLGEINGDLRARAPEDLIGLWLGHAQRTVTDLYAGGLQQDKAWRREWCERVGLGFSLVGLCGAINVVPIESVKAA